jgi:hypothetical protein
MTDRTKLFRQLWTAGVATAEIARALGISPRHVSRVAKQLNLNPRKIGRPKTEWL